MTIFDLSYLLNRKLKQTAFALCLGLTSTLAFTQVNTSLPGNNFSAYRAIGEFSTTNGPVALMTRSDEYGAIRFAPLDFLSGAPLAPPIAPPIAAFVSTFGNNQLLALRAGGFLNLAVSTSFEFPGPPPQLRIAKFNAAGVLEQSRTISTFSDSEIFEAEDGRLLLVFYRDARAQWLDLGSVNPALNGRVSFDSFCLATQPNCRISTPIIRTPKTAVGLGKSSFNLVRGVPLSAEQISLSLIRTNASLETIYDVKLGVFPVSQGYRLIPQRQGTLMLIFLAGPEREFRFYSNTGREVWRTSNSGWPVTSRIQDLQADLDGMTMTGLTSDSIPKQALFRVNGSGLIRWQRVFDRNSSTPTITIGRSGSAVLARANLLDPTPGAWDWIRADGTRPALPADLQSLAHIDSGGVIAIAKNQNFQSGYALSRFRESGELISSANLRYTQVLPTSVQLRLNPSNQIDAALSYTGYGRTQFAQIEKQAKQRPFEINTQVGLYFQSIDTIFVHTNQSTIARTVPDGRILWERDLVRGIASPRFLALGDALLAFTGFGSGFPGGATVRVIDRNGVVVSNVEFSPSQNSALTCFETDLAVTGDLARCVFRPVPFGALEIYRVRENYQIQLLNVVYRAEQFVDLARNGDLILRNEAQRLFRLSPNAQVRWQIDGVVADDRVLSAIDGSAWVMSQPYSDEAFIRHVSATGASTSLQKPQSLSYTRQPIVLSDGSLLIPSDSQIKRLHVQSGVVFESVLPIGGANERQYFGSLTSDGLRTAWVESRIVGEAQASVTTYQWPALEVNPLVKPAEK